jgi:hypothetical protein
MRRYLPAECLSVFAAIAGAAFAFRLTENWEVAALAGNWAETGAFYLVMVTREFLVMQHGRGRLAALPLVARNLTMEFALAELVDSFITRPIFMDVAMRMTGHLAIGVVIGKILGDVTFYVPTIVSYELRRRYVDAPESRLAEARLAEALS